VVAATDSKEAVLEQAKAHPEIQSQLAEKTVAKEVYVPGKLVNFVTRP
jgi:leucyl-tRNA synthetase